MLQVGSDADYIIVDPDKQATVDDSYYKGSVTEWSIYHGWEFQGLAETTVIRGEIVMDHGEITGTLGFGRYVRGAGVGAHV